MEEVSKNREKRLGMCAKPTKIEGVLHLLFIRDEKQAGLAGTAVSVESNMEQGVRKEKTVRKGKTALDENGLIL